MRRILIVSVAQIDGNLRVILKACGINAGEGATVQVQYRDGVGLLTGDISGSVVTGNVLGFYTRV